MDTFLRTSLLVEMLVDLFFELLEGWVILRHFGGTALRQGRHPVVTGRRQHHILAYHGAQLCDLILKSSDNFLILRDLVLHILRILLYVCLDVLSSVSILKRIMSLLKTSMGTRYIGYHNSATVAAQAILQQPRQF